MILDRINVGSTKRIVRTLPPNGVLGHQSREIPDTSTGRESLSRGIWAPALSLRYGGATEQVGRELNVGIRRAAFQRLWPEPEVALPHAAQNTRLSRG